MSMAARRRATGDEGCERAIFRSCLEPVCRAFPISALPALLQESGHTLRAYFLGQGACDELVERDVFLSGPIFSRRLERSGQI